MFLFPIENSQAMTIGVLYLEPPYTVFVPALPALISVWPLN